MKRQNTVCSLIILIISVMFLNGCATIITSLDSSSEKVELSSFEPEPGNANIESIEIAVSNFERGTPEITLSNIDLESEHNYFNLRVFIDWKADANIFIYDVSWTFVGDDLGCFVSIIDPCCTKGTIGTLVIGHQMGKVILKATAESVNQVSSEVIIWIGEQSNNSDLYDLEEAYNYGWLTKEDLSIIASFYNGGENFLSQMSKATEMKLKQTYLDKFYSNLLFDFADYEDEPITRVNITAYYGKYNNCVVASIWDDTDYDRPESIDITIGGVTFNNFWIREIFVWVEDNRNIVPSGIEYFRTDYSIDDGSQSIIVIESLEQLGEYFNQDKINNWGNDILNHVDQFDNDYFDKNILVFIVISENSGSNRQIIKNIEFGSQNTKINIQRLIPDVGTDDMAEWHIIIPINRQVIISKDFVLDFVYQNQIDLLDKYNLSVEAVIWNDYKQSEHDCIDGSKYHIDDLICKRCGKLMTLSNFNIDFYYNPTLNIKVFAVILTEMQRISKSFNYIYDPTFCPIKEFLLFDDEWYDIYITIEIDGEYQTIYFHQTVM